MTVGRLIAGDSQRGDALDINKKITSFEAIKDGALGRRRVIFIDRPRRKIRKR